MHLHLAIYRGKDPHPAEDRGGLEFTVADQCAFAQIDFQIAKNGGGAATGKLLGRIFNRMKR